MNKSEYSERHLLEYVRCVRDPVYFITKYVTITHHIRGDISFDMYDHQIDLVNHFENHKHNLVLSPRQVGTTEASCAYILWKTLFYDNHKTVLVSNKISNAKLLLSKIVYMYNNLPDWLKEETCEMPKKASFHLKNNSVIFTATTSPSSVRGHSINLLYMDQFSFVKPKVQREFWTSIFPCLATGSSAIMAGCLSGNDNDLFLEMWKESFKDGGPMNAFVIPWDVLPHRDDEFKKEQIELIGMDAWLREYDMGQLI